MSWKIASALEGAKVCRQLIKRSKKRMGGKAVRSLMGSPMGFVLGTVIALPLGYALVRSLRR